MRTHQSAHNRYIKRVHNRIARGADETTIRHTLPNLFLYAKKTFPTTEQLDVATFAAQTMLQYIHVVAQIMMHENSFNIGRASRAQRENLLQVMQHMSLKMACMLTGGEVNDSGERPSIVLNSEKPDHLGIWWMLQHQQRIVTAEANLVSGMPPFRAKSQRRVHIRTLPKARPWPAHYRRRFAPLDLI